MVLIMYTDFCSISGDFLDRLKRFPEVKTVYCRRSKGLLFYLYFKVRSVLYVMLYALQSDIDYFRGLGFTVVED